MVLNALLQSIWKHIQAPLQNFWSNALLRAESAKNRAVRAMPTCVLNVLNLVVDCLHCIWKRKWNFLCFSSYLLPLVLLLGTTGKSGSIVFTPSLRYLHASYLHSVYVTCRLAVGALHPSSRSLTKVLNSTDPSINPWDTPLMTSAECCAAGHNPLTWHLPQFSINLISFVWSVLHWVICKCVSSVESCAKI